MQYQRQTAPRKEYPLDGFHSYIYFAPTLGSTSPVDTEHSALHMKSKYSAAPFGLARGQRHRT